MHVVDAPIRMCVSRCTAVLLAAALAAGCATRDWDKIRREQAEAYRSKLAAATEQALADGEALDLDDCLRLALENNLAIESAHIAQRIA